LQFVLSLCVASLLVGGLHAQSNNNSTGTISDTALHVTGKAIPGASVAVKNESSGAPRAAVADQEGKYSVPNLPGGSRPAYNQIGPRRVSH
jgi:hypothetical protein